MELETVPRGFAGREFSAGELELIREVVASCVGLSRAELAKTVCELLGWRRGNGSLKGLECRRYLELLDRCGYLCLPAKRQRRPLGSAVRIPKTCQGEPEAAVLGSVEEFGPLVLQQVRDEQERRLFRELVGRYHYQGYAVAYGAQLSYLVFVSRPL